MSIDGNIPLFRGFLLRNYKSKDSVLELSAHSFRIQIGVEERLQLIAFRGSATGGILGGMVFARGPIRGDGQKTFFQRNIQVIPGNTR